MNELFCGKMNAALAFVPNGNTVNAVEFVNGVDSTVDGKIVIAGVTDLTSNHFIITYSIDTDMNVKEIGTMSISSQISAMIMYLPLNQLGIAKALIGTNDGEVKLIEINENGAKLEDVTPKWFAKHSAPITEFAFEKLSGLCSSVSEDGVLNVFNVEDDTVCFQEQFDHFPLASVVFMSSNCFVAVSQSCFAQLRIYERTSAFSSNFKRTAALRDFSGVAYIAACIYPQKDMHIVVGTDDGCLVLWDLQEKSQKKAIKLHEDCVSSLVFSSVSGCIISSSIDGSLACTAAFGQDESADDAEFSKLLMGGEDVTDLVPLNRVVTSEFDDFGIACGDGDSFIFFRILQSIFPEEIVDMHNPPAEF
eukprot:TRINITY_DN16392_c0_g1_i1.p1 TRINITY_DN16392_c0_g1~~TRINITY_DN16392_c0_g1_i1.p1  ORF type:complete len:363 (-),score=83.21 TRINITY_DN16392_c0_g1_i1:267-1355(-)